MGLGVRFVARETFPGTHGRKRGLETGLLLFGELGRLVDPDKHVAAARFVPGLAPVISTSWNGGGEST